MSDLTSGAHLRARSAIAAAAVALLLTPLTGCGSDSTTTGVSEVTAQTGAGEPGQASAGTRSGQAPSDGQEAPRPFKPLKHGSSE